MWTNYFKFKKLVPGKVVTPSHGTIDFSNPNLPVEIVKKVYESDFPYLEITNRGMKELYLKDQEEKETPPIPDDTTDQVILTPEISDQKEENNTNQGKRPQRRNKSRKPAKRNYFSS